MSLRKRQRRQNEIAEEYANHTIISNDQAILSAKADDDLFVIDRSGSKSSKKKIAKQEVATLEGRRSLAENRLISKIISGKIGSSRKKQLTSEKDVGNGLTDLWSHDDYGVEDVAVKQSKKKLKVARPGQSYNPSVTDHQDVLAEALALQILKDEKDAKSKGSLVPIQTAAVYFQDDSDDSDEDKEETDYQLNSEEANGGGCTAVVKNNFKQNVKLTKAQRNKQRTKKANKFNEDLQKQEKNLLKSIDNIPLIMKEITAIEAENEIKVTLKASRQQDNQDSTAMTFEEAGAIPLTDELKGSLRCLRPKGSNLYDQVSKMRTAGDLMDVHRRKRTAYEKPHGGKRIKWVAKYKYT